MISNNEAVLGPLISLKTIGFYGLHVVTSNYGKDWELFSKQPPCLPCSAAYVKGGGHLNLEGVESVKIKNFHVQVFR